jgi:Rod binding domain-containing protein
MSPSAPAIPRTGPLPPPAPAEALPAARRQALAAAATAFEGAFLAEMLRLAGAGAPRADLGGGAGEAQFASLLARAQAERMAAAGGLGLAEALFRALLARETGAGGNA